MRYFDKCKCCLEDGDLRDLWADYIDDGGVTENYGQMLNDCFSFSWQVSTAYSEQICESCIKRLRDALIFRNEVISAKEILDDVIEQNFIKEAKLENTKIKLETEHDIQESDNDNEENSDHEQMVQDYMQQGVLEQGEVQGSSEQGEMILGSLEQQVETYVECSSQESEHQPDEDMQVEFLEDDSEARTLLAEKRKWPKKRKKTERLKVYKKYTKDDLDKAIEMVSASKMTRAEASAKFKVPIKTLGAKLRIREAIGSDSQSQNSEDVELEKGKITKHYENIRSILLCSNATPIKGHWGIGYACCFCTKQFQDPADLKRHTATHSDSSKAKFMREKDSILFCVKLDITNLQCNLCSNEIDSLEELMDHLKDKHSAIIHRDIPHQIVPFKFDGPVLKCAICEKEFRYFKVLNEHMNCHYRNFECDLCDRAFLNRAQLRAHKYRHKRGRYPCQFCTKICTSRVRKSDHERVVHRLQSKTRKCNYCDERFCDGAAKSKHETSEHGAEPVSFQCNACLASFTRQTILTDHINKFHLLMLPFKCALCEKSYASKADIDRHMDSHAGIKRYKCDVCFKEFQKLYRMRHHVLKAHGGDE